MQSRCSNLSSQWPSSHSSWTSSKMCACQRMVSSGECGSCLTSETMSHSSSARCIMLWGMVLPFWFWLRAYRKSTVLHSGSKLPRFCLGASNSWSRCWSRLLCFMHFSSFFSGRLIETVSNLPLICTPKNKMLSVRSSQFLSSSRLARLPIRALSTMLCLQSQACPWSSTLRCITSPRSIRSICSFHLVWERCRALLVSIGLGTTFPYFALHFSSGVTLVRQLGLCPAKLVN